MSGAYPAERRQAKLLDGHRRPANAENRHEQPCTLCGARYVPRLAELWCRACIDKVVAEP